MHAVELEDTLCPLIENSQVPDHARRVILGVQSWDWSSVHERKGSSPGKKHSNGDGTIPAEDPDVD